MNVGIHQPNYLPWIGYFYKMYLSDIWVFHDGVKFSKSSYTKRVRIKEDRNTRTTKWLTVPTVHNHQGNNISDIRTLPVKEWWYRHKRILEHRYNYSKYWPTVIQLIDEAVLNSNSVLLSILNQHIIKQICKYLSIDVSYQLGSDLNVNGIKSEININIVKAMKASHYISGIGANVYQSRKDFEDVNIDIFVADITGYFQNCDMLITNPQKAILDASIFDWLMRYSPEEILDIFMQAKKYNTKTNKKIKSH